MAKKTPGTAVVISGQQAPDNVVGSTSKPIQDLAKYLGVDLSGTLDERADLAAAHMNRSQRHMLTSGLFLQSMKDDCQPGEFLALVEARGFGERAAQRAMQYAQFINSQPNDVRERLMDMPRSKVMLLAAADAEVIEVALEKGLDSIDALSVRKLQQELAEVKAQLTDEAVRRQTAETEAKGLRKKLDKEEAREDKVPVVVADLRADLMANVRKAELAIESIGQLAPQVIELIGGPASDWADPTLRQVLSGVAHLGLLADGLVGRLCTALPDGTAEPSPRSFLTQQEIAETAQAWARLVGRHLHEQLDRKWLREQKRPRGKGRPAARPVLEE